jgi:hypothetical protein
MQAIHLLAFTNFNQEIMVEVILISVRKQKKTWADKL